MGATPSTGSRGLWVHTHACSGVLTRPRSHLLLYIVAVNQCIALLLSAESSLGQNQGECNGTNFDNIAIVTF